jgi:hypothetical protein
VYCLPLRGYQKEKKKRSKTKTAMQMVKIIPMEKSQNFKG